MGILDETQEQRDQELHELTNEPLDKIRSYVIAAPENTKLYLMDFEPETEEEWIGLYEDYRPLKLFAYIRTLMYTSVYARGDVLIKILRKTKQSVCLDYGSGVGSHTIALLENDNEVDMLDVDGPLLRFAGDRIAKRGLGYAGLFHPENALPERRYDLVICTNVLEHCYSPMKELEKIRVALKTGGKMFLNVSQMVKPASGHFPRSINEWRDKAGAYLSKYFEPDFNAGMLIKK